MDIFGVPDLIHAVAQFLYDIRVLRLNRATNEIIMAEPEYALWQKCAAANSIYAHGTPRMFDGKTPSPHDIEQAVEFNNVPAVKYLAGSELPRVLNAAARYGQIGIIRDYRVSDYDESVVRSAAEYGQLAVLEFMFSIGTKIKYHDDVFYKACIGNRTEIVKYLVDVGLTFSRIDDGSYYDSYYGSYYGNDDDAIDVVCRNGNCEIADILISVGARPDSVLYSAVNYNQGAIVDLAIAHGADFTDPALVYAVCDGKSYELLESIDVDKDKGLHQACLCGDPVVAKYYISQGATVRLISAVRGGNLDIVKLVMCDEKITEDDLWAALTHPPVAKYLIECGANTSEHDYQLRLEILDNNLKNISALADAGIPITKSLVFCAVKSASLKTINLLLSYASELRDYAIQSARNCRRYDIANALEQRA